MLETYYENFLPDLSAESRGLIQLASQTPTLSFAIFDKNGDCLMANQNWAENAGGMPGELCGESLAKFAINDDATAADLIQKIGLVHARGIPFVSDSARRVFRRLPEAYFHLNYFPIRSRDERCIGVGICAAMVVNTNHRFQLMADSLPVLVSYVDSTERYRFCNSTYEQWLGFSKEQMAGMTLRDLLGEQAYKWAKPYIDKALAGSPSRHEKLMRSADGQLRTIVAEYIPDCDDDRSVRGFFIIAHDVTDQRRTEKFLREQQKQLQTLTDAIPSMISYVGRNQRYKFVNAAYERKFNRPIKELIGKHVRQIIGQERYERARPYLLNALNGHGSKIEATELDDDGKTRYLEIKFIPDPDNTGAVRGVVVTIDDVTDLRRTAERAEHAAKARDEFISVASHELKTPLTSLRLKEQIITRRIREKGFASLSQEKVLQALQNSEKQTDRLLRLVDDMLDMSRIVHRKLRIRPELVRLDELVRNCLDDLRTQLEQAGCTIDCQLDEVVGYWDRYRIEQVFNNLMTNAMRYGAGQPIQIGVRRSGPNAIVTVKDNGMGIEATERERIFERFERADSSSDVAGLGMGLYISRELARAHGGDIEVDSTPGQGALFSVHLPLSEENPGE